MQTWDEREPNASIGPALISAGNSLILAHTHSAVLLQLGRR